MVSVLCHNAIMYVLHNCSMLHYCINLEKQSYFKLTAVQQQNALHCLWESNTFISVQCFSFSLKYNLVSAECFLFGVFFSSVHLKNTCG